MKISSILAVKKPSVSFEVFPPKKDKPLEGTKEIVTQIAAARPSFMSVTYGAAGGSTGANTCAIASHVKHRCGVPVLAHLTCVASSRETIRRQLDDFRAAGIENILCLRGDRPADVKPQAGDVFSHASDLVSALRGEGFCLGGACYPEGHPESETLEEDIEKICLKVDAGLDFLTTQMFFDNNVYFHYVSRLREAGVTIPVVAGIMPVTNKVQIKRICELSGTHLTPRFRAIADRFGGDPTSMFAAGIAYATAQIIDLFANGVNHVHVYTMNKPEIAQHIMSGLKGIVGNN